MRVTYERGEDMAYLYLTEIEPGQASRQVPLDIEGIAGTIILDLDSQGRVLGLEFFEASRVLPQALLKAAGAPRAEEA